MAVDSAKLFVTESELTVERLFGNDLSLSKAGGSTIVVERIRSPLAWRDLVVLRSETIQSETRYFIPVRGNAVIGALQAAGWRVRVTRVRVGIFGNELD